MIHAYAIEPDVAVSWCDRSSLRFVRDKFGLGTPRMFLELQKFPKWKKAAYYKAEELYKNKKLSDLEKTRLGLIFDLIGERRVRRKGETNLIGDRRVYKEIYDGNIPWLVNAEAEYNRHPFAAIIAMTNPRKPEAVITESELRLSEDPRWDKPTAVTSSRNAKALAKAVSAMLENCSELVLVDPHFGPENDRHRKLLKELAAVAMRGRDSTLRVTLHCADKSTLEFFQEKAAAMAKYLPAEITLYFKRWSDKNSDERFHNRYILTDIGGVIFGTGLDAGPGTETEDINLMSKDQYIERWQQFTGQDNPLDLVDEPAPFSIIGRG